MKYLVSAFRSPTDPRGHIKVDRMAFETVTEALAWSEREAVRSYCASTPVPWTAGTAPKGYAPGIWEMSFGWPTLPDNLEGVLPEAEVRRRRNQHAARVAFLRERFEQIDGVTSVVIERADRAQATGHQS